MKYRIFPLCAALLFTFLGGSGTPAAATSPSPMVWVEKGVSTAPIIVPVDDPTEEVHQAANDLAGYVERITGSRPEVILGTPDPLPERAVWVGYQPILNTLFPDLDFDFKSPEEILIAANDRNLVIAGRDREPFIIPANRESNCSNI